MNIYAPARRAEPAAGASPGEAHELKYREDAAAYVAAMVAELRQIAGKAGFERLVKSLEAAYYEAYGALDAKAHETARPPRQDGPAKNVEKISPAMEPKGA